MNEFREQLLKTIRFLSPAPPDHETLQAGPPQRVVRHPRRPPAGDAAVWDVAPAAAIRCKTLVIDSIVLFFVVLAGGRWLDLNVPVHC